MYKTKGFKFLYLTLIFSLLLGLAVNTNTYGATAKTKNITLAAINDFHGSVDESGKNVGIAKVADALDKLKQENPNTVFLGAGDLFQGSATSNLTKGAVVNDALKKMGMVASAIGNHEFDWGVSSIPAWAKSGGYNFLASNIYDKTTGQPVTWAKPYKIIKVDGIKIGLIGLSTPQTAYQTTPANVANLEF
ncbi:MAG: metallophosphoesterase, partial [Oscillospiraceae bacterium]|nr:metallophosphoesterase [Oscillospiraceae bacterium]